jgi:hypothetical protein
MISQFWCIKNDNDLITNYFNIILDTNCYDKHKDAYLHSFNELNKPLEKLAQKSFSHHYVKPGYIEITLEQFKKYILKPFKTETNYKYLIKLFKKLKIK